MESILIDTSVIIKWYKTIGEEKTREARKYLSDHLNGKRLLSLPELTVFELLNLAVLDKNLTQEEWDKIIEDFFNLSLRIISLDNELAKETYHLGKKYGITAYDASYVACAKVLGINFLTADKKLVKKLNLSFVRSL